METRYFFFPFFYEKLDQRYSTNELGYLSKIYHAKGQTFILEYKERINEFVYNKCKFC